jgi:hypothetical protein
MHRALTSSVLAAFALLASACAGSSPGLSAVGGADGGGTTDPNGGGGGIVIPNDPASDAGVASNCAESAKLIYLVTTSTAGGANELYSFNPTKPGRSAYTRIGALSCPSSSSPQTMGVDRAGTAWVFYSDGRLFKVDVTTARCTATSFTYPGAGLDFTMGSGFTALGGDVARETLFLVRNGLQRFDTAALTRTFVGGPTTTSGELTGGPDGKLFVFDPAGSGRLLEVNPTTGITAPLHTFPTGTFTNVSAFAFARYAGSFYLFTAGTDSTGFFPTNTRTTVFDPQSRATTIRDADIGVTVVGAGQSVCVPPPIF